MNDFFSRTDIGYYKNIVRSKHPESASFCVELDQGQMAVILQIHDYGLDGITDEETQLLYSVIATLKNRIHL